MECQVDVTAMEIPNSEWDDTFTPNACCSQSCSHRALEIDRWRNPGSLPLGNPTVSGVERVWFAASGPHGRIVFGHHGDA